MELQKQTIVTHEIAYTQLLDDVRAVVRHEIDLARVATSKEVESENLLTVQEAAELLNVCSATVHDYKKRGLLPFHKMRGRTYLKRSEVLAALKKQQPNCIGKEVAHG